MKPGKITDLVAKAKIQLLKLEKLNSDHGQLISIINQSHGRGVVDKIGELHELKIQISNAWEEFIPMRNSILELLGNEIPSFEVYLRDTPLSYNLPKGYTTLVVEKKGDQFTISLI